MSIFLLRLYFARLKVIEHCKITPNYISYICNIGVLPENWCKIVNYVMEFDFGNGILQQVASFS